MALVVFDSSFLMAVAERPTTWREDIANSLGGYAPVILDCVLRELDVISAGPGKRARLALLAKEFTAGFRVEKCGRADVDDELVSFATTSDAFLATVDAELLDRMRVVHGRAVTLRGGRVALA